MQGNKIRLLCCVQSTVYCDILIKAKLYHILFRINQKQFQTSFDCRKFNWARCAKFTVQISQWCRNWFDWYPKFTCHGLGWLDCIFRQWPQEVGFQWNRCKQLKKDMRYAKMMKVICCKFSIPHNYECLSDLTQWYQ